MALSLWYSLVWHIRQSEAKVVTRWWTQLRLQSKHAMRNRVYLEALMTEGARDTLQRTSTPVGWMAHHDTQR